jgi:hypothetical protein
MNTALTTPAQAAPNRRERRAAASVAPRCFTPPTAAEFLGVSPEKVIAWIKRGELRASNITADPRGRPRYIITPAALEDFLRSREPKPPAPHPKRRRKADDVPDFFPDIS